MLQRTNLLKLLVLCFESQWRLCEKFISFKTFCCQYITQILLGFLNIYVTAGLWEIKRQIITYLITLRNIKMLSTCLYNFCYKFVYFTCSLQVTKRCKCILENRDSQGLDIMWNVPHFLYRVHIYEVDERRWENKPWLNTCHCGKPVLWCIMYGKCWYQAPQAMCQEAVYVSILPTSLVSKDVVEYI